MGIEELVGSDGYLCPLSWVYGRLTFQDTHQHHWHQERPVVTVVVFAGRAVELITHL